MNKNSTPTIHVLFLILAIIVTGSVFFIAQRQISLDNRLQAEAELLRRNREKLGELANILPSFNADMKRWADTLPGNEAEVATFAAQIERLAGNQNLTFELNLDDFPGPVDVNGHYVDGLGAGITVDGAYQGVTNFLTNMSALPYYFKIEKLTITKNETKPGVKAIINGALMMDLIKK